MCDLWSGNSPLLWRYSDLLEVLGGARRKNRANGYKSRYAPAFVFAVTETLLIASGRISFVKSGIGETPRKGPQQIKAGTDETKECQHNVQRPVLDQEGNLTDENECLRCHKRFPAF